MIGANILVSTFDSQLSAKRFLLNRLLSVEHRENALIVSHFAHFIIFEI